MEELWRQMSEDGLYSKSFEEFKQKYGNEEGAKILHQGLSEDGLYSKDLNSFKNRYNFVALAPSEQEVVDKPATYDDVLDLSKPITVIDKSEGQVQTELLKDSHYAGLAVEKSGILWGDAITYTLPNGEKTYVDLQNNKEEEVKKLEALNAWYDDPENAKRAASGFWSTIGTAAASVGVSRYESVDVDDINTSLEKMAVIGGNSYSIDKGFKRGEGGGHTYTLLNNGNKVETFNTVEDVQKYLWDNLTETELGRSYKEGLEMANALIEKTKAAEDIKYHELTDEDAMENWVADGRARTLLESKSKGLNLNTDDQALFDSMLASDDAIVEAISGIPYGNDVRARFKNLYNSLGGEYDSRTVANDPREYSDEGREKIKSLLENLNLPPQELDAEKRRMADTYGSKWFQENLRKDPNYRDIQSALDVVTSETNVKSQFENWKTVFKTLEKESTKDLEKISSQGKAIFEDMQALYDSGEDIGWETIELNGKERVVVTGGDEYLVKEYQSKIDKHQGLIDNMFEEYKKEHEESVRKFGYWESEAQEYAEAAQISNREFDTLTLMGEDFLNGWETMALGLPAAFGSQSAMDGIDAINAEAEGLELDLGWEEALEFGGKMRYFGRSTSKQAANVITAVGLSSLSLPPMVSTGLISTTYGLTASGQKRTELRTLSRLADQAKLDLEKLKKLKDKMSPEEYERTEVELRKTIAIGDLEPWQVEAAVWGTGIIEGGITAAFSGFSSGSLGNARKILKNFGGGITTGTGRVTTNMWWQNLGDFAWDFGKRVGTEVIEEESIMGLSVLWDSLITGKEVDFSEWDETLIQTLMIAGPMNGVPGGYAAVTQHYATADGRAIYKDVTKNIADITRKLGNPDIKPEMKEKLQQNLVYEIERLGLVTSGMEVDAMVSGPKNLRALAANAIDLSVLYAEAGIDHRDSPADKKQKIEDHIAKLKEKSKKDAQNWEDRLEVLMDEQKSINDETVQKYELTRGAAALEEGGLIHSIYGRKGLKMALDLAEKDPEFKKLSSREQLIKIHEKVKKKFRDSKVADAKRNPKVVAAVEARVYDEVDEDGNKLEGGKEGYFKRHGKKRRTSAQVKYENDLYSYVALQYAANQAEAIVLNEDITLNAPPGVTEADIKSFEDILDDDGNVVTSALQQITDYVSTLDVDNSTKRTVIEAFENGTLNGTIIDGKYIVLDKEQAKKNLANGQLLQATAILHEYSHFLDNITMKDGEKVLMAENLNESLESNPKLIKLHEEAKERAIEDGYWDPNKDFKDQSKKAKDEYVQSVEEMLLQRAFWRELNEAKKVGGGIANTLKALWGGDFNFNSKGAALHYIVEYGQSWLRGEDSKLVGRKKKVFAQKLKELRDELAQAEINKDKDAVSKLKNEIKKLESGTTSDSRAARDGFAEKSIAEDLGLKDSTKKIVAKNEEIYQRIVDIAKARGVNVSKDLVTQRMRDELVENNLARAFALARKAAGVARNLTLEEGLKIDNVTEWFQEYSLKLAELAKTWDPSKNDSFGAYMNQLLPKKYSGILEGLKSELETKSMDSDEATRRRVEAVEVESDTQTESRPDTRRKKTNVLKIGNVEGKTEAIKDAVEVNEGDTFKEVSDNNTGKVAEIIFDVPANKITDPKKNLTYAKRIVNGIPEASEAGNIQSFYIAPQTVDKLLKILPEESVSSDTADINEIGENIDVDREVLGRGLGLSNRVLNYFYEKTNERSKGKKSQPFIWKLKPEFKNPTPKTIAQVQEDLGITPRGELNNYDRNIGQLLKGVAKFQAQQTALSTAQRILTERKAPKKQIASVTAAQSKVAFSTAHRDIDLLPPNPEFEMDGVTHIDKLLADIGQEGIFRHRSQQEIDDYFDAIENVLIPILPEALLPRTRLKSFIRPSNRIFPGKRSGFKGRGVDLIEITTKEGDIVKMTIDDYFNQKREELLTKELNYGKPFTGAGSRYRYGQTYAEQFGAIEGEIAKSFQNGVKDDQNAINKSMHEQLWQRINKSIADTKGESARAWGSWLSLVGQDTEHPHRMGAEMLGYSLNPKGTKNKKGQVKLYEWEHAMPATKAYLYLLKSAISEEFSFESSYGLVMDNFKLVALDGAQAVKLTNAKRGVSMGTEWSILTDSWLDRYFHDDVVAVRGGIDPSSIVGTNGKTFAEIFNINAAGVDPAFEFVREAGKRSKDSKVMDQALKASRSSTKPKGISVLDFDDTLATTKSNVLYTLPDGTQGKLNAEEFAKEGGNLLAQGAEFDFSEFNKVVKGETAPLFNKAMKLYGKFGADDMFILTARAPESAKAIKQFLDAQGLKIPLKNIVGLGRSEASAKANWIAEKVGEGYNDFYFADDAIQNVEAVKATLNKLEVKNKVQQAKIKFSMNTKRDLKWTETNFGAYKHAEFKVGDNAYRITLKNTPLAVKREDKFKDLLFIEGETWSVEFNHVSGVDIGDKHRMGILDTGRAAEVLSIVSNGVFDFIKDNKVNAVGFESYESSRSRLYNTLTKFWASKLGWEWTMDFGTDINPSGDRGRVFVISKPGIKTKPINPYSPKNASKQTKDILNQFDVKGKVQQAKVKFSQTGGKKMADIIDEGALDLDIILEQSKDVGRRKKFSAAKARKRGKGKGRFKFFLPPSAEDLKGLIYPMLGKGKVGEKHHAWFKKHLFDPFAKGIRHLNMVTQAIANDIKELKKALPEVKNKLRKTVPGTEFTYQDAVRVYNWDKAGFDIPGLSNTDKSKLIQAVNNDQDIKTFADGLNTIMQQSAEGNLKPGDNWIAGTIESDINEAMVASREVYLGEWQDNVDVMFSEENLNKIEAVFGSNHREALEDMLYRMRTGSTRNFGSNRLTNSFTQWLNGSVGATMFFNMRSALLQQLSNINFINWHDNNPIKAAKAFANQKQFWADVVMIFNSPWLKQRRGGIGTDLNAAELLRDLQGSKNPMKSLIAHLLRVGFTPTQIGDSIAIATGGATMYRNRVQTYLDQGMSKSEAETKAFEDMMEIAEETQQSTRADKISQQQASPLGKFILAFQNVTMQYNRLMKRAAQDLVNGRGDPKEHISKIIYYGTVQSMIFYGLQQALFAAMFDDDDEIDDKKKAKLANSMLDSLLRGSGVAGAVVSTLKNVVLKFMEENEKLEDDKFYTDMNEANIIVEALNLSPPLGIKARKMHSALKTWHYNDDIIKHMDKTDIDNPAYEAVFNVTEAVTNLPIHRVYNKAMNIREAMNSDHETWKRVAVLMGWSRWSFGIRNQDVIDARGEVKEIKAKEKKEPSVEDKALQKRFIEDQKRERKEGKKTTCAAVNKAGERCSLGAYGKTFCTIHQEVKQNTTGKKTQCTHIKDDGARCKMKTSSASGKCYYHD